MKIKIKDNTYETIKVPQYNRLRSMLMTIFSANPTKFDFHGIIKKGKRGILVCGTDKNKIREFQRFYPISDIHHYFNRYIRLLKKNGERRLTTISVVKS